MLHQWICGAVDVSLLNSLTESKSYQQQPIQNALIQFLFKKQYHTLTVGTNRVFYRERMHFNEVNMRKCDMLNKGFGNSFEHYVIIMQNKQNNTYIYIKTYRNTFTKKLKLEFLETK